MKFLLSALAVATVAAQSACRSNPCGLNAVCEDNADSPTGYSCIPLPSRFQTAPEVATTTNSAANPYANAQVFNGVYGAPRAGAVYGAPRMGAVYGAPRAMYAPPVYAAPQAVRVMRAPVVAEEEQEDSWNDWNDAKLNADAYDDYAGSFHPVIEQMESPVGNYLYANSQKAFGAALENKLNRAKAEGDEEEVEELTMQLDSNNFYKTSANMFVVGENEGGFLLDAQAASVRAAAIQEELKEMDPNSQEAYNGRLEYDVWSGKSMRSYANYNENEGLHTLFSLQVGQAEQLLAQDNLARAQNAYRMNPTPANQEELELANLQVQAAQMEINALTTEVIPGFEELLGGRLGSLYTFQKWSMIAEIQRRREAIEARKYFERTGMNPYTDPRATDFQWGAKKNAPLFGDISLFGTNF